MGGAGWSPSPSPPPPHFHSIPIYPSMALNGEGQLKRLGDTLLSSSSVCYSISLHPVLAVVVAAVVVVVVRFPLALFD